MAAPDHKKKPRLANSVKGKQPCKQRSHDGNGSTGAVLWGCSQSVNATVRKHTGGHCVRYFSNCVSVYEVLTVIAIKARLRVWSELDTGAFSRYFTYLVLERREMTRNE